MSGTAGHRRRVQDPTVFDQPSDLVNRATRVFRASPARVFRFFTERATAPYLWSAEPKDVRIEAMDVRPGGRYSLWVKTPDGSTLRFFGEYREIVPPARVVNTFEVSSQPGVVAVETDLFEPVPEGTRVTVTWSYPRREDRDAMGGPEAAAYVTELWDSVAELLTRGVDALPGSPARARSER